MIGSVTDVYKNALLEGFVCDDLLVTIPECYKRTQENRATLLKFYTSLESS
jgi:hypothetical protein